MRREKHCQKSRGLVAGVTKEGKRRQSRLGRSYPEEKVRWLRGAKERLACGEAMNSERKVGGAGRGS